MAGKKRDIARELGVASDPRVPAPWDAPMANAVKALCKGEATPDQQQRFMRFIELASGVNDLEFRTDERLSSFASGKRFVGLQVRKLATLDPRIVDAVANADNATGD